MDGDGSSEILPRLNKKNYAISGTWGAHYYHHRGTARGLQIQGNNFTSWPTSHLQEGYQFPLHLPNAECFPLPPDEGQQPKNSGCELSLQVVSNSSWWRFLPWQTWRDINCVLIQIGIFYYFLLHCIASLIFWNGNNFSGSANSRPRNCTHPRSKQRIRSCS